VTGTGTGNRFSTDSAGPLSPQAELDRALRELLRDAAAWVWERSAGLSCGPSLLLILGSAASGEATGVPLGAQLLPLSDLDLGLFLAEGPTNEQADALRRELADHLRPAIARLALTHDPVDLGIYHLDFVRRMPPTLELGEAARSPRVLAGDPELLRGLAAPAPLPFEALRLALNRLAEAFAELEPAAWRSGPHAAVLNGELRDWPAEPDASTWRWAHRYAKLPVDLLKALLAARGTLEPSLARRVVLARPALRAAGLDPGEPGRWAGLDAAVSIEAWIRWRLAPQWPPPRLPLGGIGDMTRAVLAAVCQQLTCQPPVADRPQTWAAVLAAEGGPTRERLRRWMRMVAHRPAGVGRKAALHMALRWAPRQAWPGSLALLAFGLSWLAAAEDPDPARLPRALEAGAETALNRGRGMVHWARSAGA